MNYKDNNFVFLRCVCRTKTGGDPTPRVNSIVDRFLLKSDWMSSLMYSLKFYFKSISFVICIADKYEYLCRTENIDGVNLVITTISNFKILVDKKCGILYMRNGIKEFVPPTNILSVYYGASTDIYPKHKTKWGAIISCKEERDKSVHKWIKGSNGDFWSPSDYNKEYDFVCLGRPGKDAALINRIAKMFPDKRILVTGIPKNQLDKNIEVLGWEVNHKLLRDILRKSKWGIASACKGGEGFPMSIQLEYALVGLPYVYATNNVPKDGYYVNDATAINIDNFDFNKWEVMSNSTRVYAEQNLSSEVSAKSLIKILDKINKK